MTKIITGIYQYYFENIKLIMSSNSSLMNPFTINCLHLAYGSSCKHLIRDCLSILSGSGFTCSKQYLTEWKMLCQDYSFLGPGR